MSGRRRTIAVTAVALLLLAANIAYAHDGAEHDGTARDNRHVLHESDSDGHIPANTNYGLRPVGQDVLGGVSEGRYTDVWAAHGHAYVGTFQEPTCDRSGVYVSDIRDPSEPHTVAMIASPPDTRVNDVKTIDISNIHFSGTVLIHTLEPCGPILGTGNVGLGQGGVSLFDVTQPSRPVALDRSFLDVGVHNTFPWSPDGGQTAYLILVDNVNERDVVLVDISKPQAPQVLTSVGLPDWPAAQDGQSEGMGAFAASLNHDVWVREIDGRFYAVVSYWDAGFVVLDVTDPSDPQFVGDSTYPDADRITGFTPPEGNAHAAAFDEIDGRWVFAGDEDFDAFRVEAEITSGPFSGESFDASQGSDVPQIDDDTSLVGPTRYVGLACDSSVAVPTAAEGEVALVQRGDCTFTEKARNVSAAGYAGGIVFNHSDGCEGMVSMLVEGDIPFLFVRRSTGFQILGMTGYDPASCGGEVPEVGSSGSDVSIQAFFDGWGYFHLLDRGTLDHRGHYAPAEVNDVAYAAGFGDLTMHNVVGDTLANDRAFISWYSLGMRAVEVGTGASISPPSRRTATPGVDDYYGDNVTEVGRFIAPEGSNFWGVYVTEVDGTRYVLGSDRDTGLWIFAFDPTYCDPSCPTTKKGKGKG